MASGLLSQIDSDHEGVLLYKSFLQADFDGVIQRAADFWDTYPDLASAAAENNLMEALRGDVEGPGLIWAVTIELIRCLGLIADSLRRGDDARLETALSKLHALDELADAIFSHDAALVLGLCARSRTVLSQPPYTTPCASSQKYDQRKLPAYFATGGYSTIGAGVFCGRRNSMELSGCFRSQISRYVRQQVLAKHS